MATILGQPTRFIHCTKYTTLTDELSRLSNDLTTRVVVISSLTGIVVNLTGTSEIKKAIERAMGTLAGAIKELVLSNSTLRVFIAPCTPRTLPNFQEYAGHALVLNLLNIKRETR
jgi:hypothetical protein